MNELHTAPSVVTIGTFDGVHRGHQQILAQLTAEAQKSNLRPVVLTFFPHPRMVVAPQEPIFLLQSISERCQMLTEFGAKDVVVQTFDHAFSELSAEEYVRKILLQKLHAKCVIVGYDHRFGHGRSADIGELRHYGELYGFEVKEISAQTIDAITISSSKIRKALENGQIAQANDFLGHHYCLCGEVVHGAKLGRTIGYPTANIQIKEGYKLIPKHGVYAVYSFFQGKKIYGMMSIGLNPTIEGKGQSIEVHFFDFQEDLYGQVLHIYLHNYLREEVKFANITQLQAQIADDEKCIRQHFGL